MSYEQRAIILKKICKSCDEKHTCKFGCDKWEEEMNKLAK